MMRSILSIQSYVAYGYVGNRAAVFPLQRLGFDVMAINTVQFSNHTGYGRWQGDIFSAEQLHKLMDGIREQGVFSSIGSVLSGYMGSAELGAFIVEVVRELKTMNTDFIYCCDPVIGDVGRGIFVRPGVGEYFKDVIIHLADILTPNQFELEYLTGEPIQTIEQTIAACQALTALGPRVILVTSLLLKTTPSDTIQMLLYTSKGAWLIETPRFALNPPPNGAGDVTAALLLGHLLKKESPENALEKVAGSIYGIFEATFKAGSRELQLIAAQDDIVEPRFKFKARVL